MQRPLLGAVLLLGACLLAGCPNPATQPFLDCVEGCWSETWREVETGGRLEFDPATTNFGAMESGVGYDADITVKNVGTRSLMLWGIDLWSQDLCSVRCPENDLSPGEETTWSVRAACIQQRGGWALDAWINTDNSENYRFEGVCPE